MAIALPAWVSALCTLIGACALALGIVCAPWRTLRRNAPAHVWCGGIVTLALLWTLQPSVVPPASMHLLGIAAYTLLAGPALAAIGSAIALVIAAVMRAGDWANVGAAYAVVALVPIGITWLVLHVVQRVLRADFLVHVFVNGWVGGALSLIASQVTADGVTVAIARLPMPLPGSDLAALIAGLASCEAMLTGMVLTLFALAQPQILQAAGIGPRPLHRHSRGPRR